MIFYEISNAFHRSVIAGQLSAQEASEALAIALSLNITLHSNLSLHSRALQLAQQFNLPAAYDAHYLALSKQFSAQVYTSDRRLWNSVHTSLTWVNLVA